MKWVSERWLEQATFQEIIAALEAKLKLTPRDDGVLLTRGTHQGRHQWRLVLGADAERSIRATQLVFYGDTVMDVVHAAARELL